jgi:hypothetical protein
MFVATAIALAVGCTNPPGSGPGAPPTTLEPLAGPPGTFEVLTYNVAGLPAGISGANPQWSMQRISPLLNDYDVVLTQEDFDWWQPLLDTLDFANYHTRLRAQATHPYRSGQHPGPLAVGLNPAARPLMVGDGLGWMSRFPFTGERRVPWTGCFGGALPDGGASDCLAMKGFGVVRMTLADGFEVDVYDLHGEAGGTPVDQDLQEADFAQLATFIAAHSAGRAVILGGDTNLHTDLEHPDGSEGADIAIWESFLAATGLTDACTALACDEPGSIDKIAFRDGGGVDLEALGHAMPVEEFSYPSGAPLSDHPPVAVELSWDAVPSP